MTLLVIDVSCLSYRLAFAMGAAAESPELQTAFLRDVQYLKSQLCGDSLAFCFDRGRPLRANLYPEYKANRSGLDPEVRALARDTILGLHNETLRKAGYQNLFSQKGYEADDLMAACVDALEPQDEAILITSDHDAYQLLGPRCWIWNPCSKKPVTQESFGKQYGISPTQWADVKALAGCRSDGIAGIRGIGERLAIRHLQGKLPPGSKAFQTIVENSSVWERNLPLVSLPFPGVRKCHLRE